MHKELIMRNLWDDLHHYFRAYVKKDIMQSDTAADNILIPWSVIAAFLTRHFSPHPQIYTEYAVGTLLDVSHQFNLSTYERPLFQSQRGISFQSFQSLKMTRMTEFNREFKRFKK